MMKMAELLKPSYNIIIQECIEDSLGRDLRVLVVNGKVVGCMMRQSVDGDFRANITRGGEPLIRLMGILSGLVVRVDF